MAPCSTPLTSSANGCLARVWSGTTPSPGSTRVRTFEPPSPRLHVSAPSDVCNGLSDDAVVLQGNSSASSTCTPRRAECCRTSAWTLTFRTRVHCLPRRTTSSPKAGGSWRTSPSTCLASSPLLGRTRGQGNQLTHPRPSHPDRSPRARAPLPRPVLTRASAGR